MTTWTILGSDLFDKTPMGFLLFMVRWNKKNNKKKLEENESQNKLQGVKNQITSNQYIGVFAYVPFSQRYPHENPASMA